uniref:MIP18 family-like domain-containing protein n=1 Tax=Pyramimonas obovata TaxID=1411642 RepID=A0A7S0NA52_9CHLO|mmetsp:Transcript_2367/g.4817  ORF Transcript_2367/g.4817 Transcript_2367/m.4817 type:complete len:163 (+) Transcript_2367:371-859(+)|eukprot:CAMPEP_0118935486 /NCGR_PEP_ID=MMETSP1169-20130426/15670_1 /TAXON_ID=36882 /ORGANISM="Pyramimonas obovata, Strain CCMP722" /LENGTH=162 /DNA_ID=CAMNT_0006878531 /DNA_START=370 /DNA_END=858 /DNA_ORIENTATION=+
MSDKINPNPVVHDRRDNVGVKKRDCTDSNDESVRDPFDALEVYEHLRDIMDPEHPYTLEQLKVVNEGHIDVDDEGSRIRVQFTPTVPHCSMATLIGLSLRVKLLQSLPRRFKVDIFVYPGSHASEHAVNKQLNDKERVAAALENQNLVEMVKKALNGVPADA